MIPPTLLEILLIFLLILANGVFAMSEIAVVSARKVRLQQRAEQGDVGARAAFELAQAPNRFLSTVQIGITLIGIFAGAFGGATLAEEIQHALGRYPLLAPYSEALSVVLVVMGTTYLSLVIGELVPKQIGLNNAERIASMIARPMRVLSVLASPIVTVLTFSTDSILRLLRVKASSEPAITEQEITTLIEQGILGGTFKRAEHEIVERVFALDNRRVTSLMTPRTEIVWIDVDDPLEESFQKIALCGHAYLPLCEGSPDHILGVIAVKSLWARMVRGEAVDLRAEIIPALFIPESTPILKLINLLQENRQHMALVIDEFAGIEGLITLTDILEALVGDLPSIDDQSEDLDIVRREDGSWLVDGKFPTDELKERFELDTLPGDERGLFRTLGGFIMSNLGRIPGLGDYVEWAGYRFEVVDMDGHRVDKVLIQKRPVPDTPPIPTAETSP